MDATTHGDAFRRYGAVGGKFMGLACTSWPLPPGCCMGDASSAPEACSVPWPDNFNDSEETWQYQTMTSGTQLEAELPVEEVVTAMFSYDLPSDDAAKQTWLVENEDETGEDNSRAKRRFHSLPDFVTTLIVRNIPYSYTQADLEEEWPMRHFPYDYLHLPLDARNRPLGYAYINFLFPMHASAFHVRWHGRFLTKHHFSKSLSVTVAHRQGKHANLTCVKGNNLRVGLPALFQGGIKLTDEEALQAIQMAKRSMVKPSFCEGRFQ